MTDREKFDLIERYLAGKLTTSEQETFEKLWATDPDFADEVNYHELVNDFIIDAGLLNVKQKLSEYTHAKSTPRPNFFKKVVGRTQNLLIASIVLILAGFGLGLWLVPQPFNSSGNKEPQTTAKNPDSSVPNSSPNDKNAKSGIPEANKENPDQSFSDIDKNNASNESKKLSSSSDRDNLKGANSPKNSLNRRKKLKLSSNINFSSKKALLKKSRPVSNASVSIPERIQERLAKLTCASTYIKGQVKSVPSCQDKRNGKLKVMTETIEGGRPPYSYKLGRNKRFSEKSVKSQLGKGEYVVQIKDNLGCIDTLASQIKIKSEQCGKRSFTFVPKQETRWKFPFKDEPSGRIKIFHEGKEVYTDRINQGIPLGWNGRFNDGQKASMGLYRVVFKPIDGQPRIWLLTVIR